jgi:hypothetical protein
MMTSPRILALTFAVLLAAASCASDSIEIVAEPGALGHIHDLVLSSDDTLLVASHSGLYRIDNIDRAVLVGTEQHDLMSMSADADGLLASGHPDLRLEKYRVQDHPPHLGLARSADLGHTWTVEADLLGMRDFHALVPTGDGIFAADSQGTVMLRQPNGVWTERGELAARDLAVKPGDTGTLVGTDYDGQIWRSNDGGRTWSLLDGAPKLIEIDWPESDRLVGADEDGTIWVASTPEGPWTSVISGLEEIETLHVDNDQWWLAMHGGAIHTSTDQGQTWTAIYLPPER